MEEILYEVGLSLVDSIGPRKFAALLNVFGSAKEVFSAPENELIPIVGRVSTSQIKKFDLRKAEEELRRANELGVEILVYSKDGYPEGLTQIPDPPILLYRWGSLREFPDLSLAIVGTRNATHYGLKYAYNFSKELAAHGLCIVSGGAKGIDRKAHEGAIDGGGKTIAVLGCGVDVTYPRDSFSLFERIKENGALISEFPFGKQPYSSNFPLRNRIIAALSKAVFVVEAPASSGALITARWSLEIGRDVFALPGPIDRESSLGCNRLLRDGAKPILEIDDILEEFGMKRRKKSLKLSDKEKKIFEILTSPLHINEIAERSGMEVKEVFPILLSLLMKGAIFELPGKYYEKCS